ncbi:MAG TPA: TonB family protein, partial [Lysobacter sp.]|nr:TonB family protein [Lysobacter sp.]
RIVSSVRGATAAPTQQATPTPTALPTPIDDEKIERDARMARLAAELHLRSQRYAKRPKRKFVSASTQEYVWAGYLREWVDRVERVGNLNYPEEVRRRRLSGQVVITIAVRRNGSVERADIVQSSGIPALDQAALRIAAMAEPYPALPRTQEDPDILHVTRTWWFRPEGTLVDE